MGFHPKDFASSINRSLLEIKINVIFDRADEVVRQSNLDALRKLND